MNVFVFCAGQWHLATPDADSYKTRCGYSTIPKPEHVRAVNTSPTPQEPLCPRCAAALSHEAAWGVRAVRSNASVFGAADAWAKKDCQVFRGSQTEAQALADQWNRNTTANVHYYPQRFDEGW